MAIADKKNNHPSPIKAKQEKAGHQVKEEGLSSKASSEGGVQEYAPNVELARALHQAHKEVPRTNLYNKTREELTELLAISVKDVATLIEDYLVTKRRKIKRTQGMKNSLMKVTALYKERFHNIIKSRDIAHLDTIIEEYLNLDEINNRLLFGGKGSMGNQVKQETYPVNHITVTSLAYNQRLLNPDVKQAIDKEVSANDDFNLIKIHGVHHCNHELKAFDAKMSAKFAEIDELLKQRRRSEIPRS